LIIMSKRRHKSQAYTRQVRASVKTFLRGSDFAPRSEIIEYVRNDDSLIGLSKNARERVADTVMRSPVFLHFNTVNSVDGKPHTLWRVNESYEEFQPVKKD